VVKPEVLEMSGKASLERSGVSVKEAGAGFRVLMEIFGGCLLCG